jgi:hypothetical protein
MIMKRAHMLSSIVLASAMCLATSPVRASTGCPSGLVLEPDATGAVVDAGWSGLAHRMPVPGYAFRMDLSCAATSPPCGTCAITGLEPNAGGNNQRCTNDTSIACTAATEVADCGAPGLCRFFAGPPTPVSAGGVGSCYTTEVIGAVSGTVNVDTGAVAPAVPLQVQLYTGFTDHPCARCVGDPTPNDNVRGGTCDDGARAGLGCDGNGVAEYPDFGVTSFDCPKSALASKIADFVLGTVDFSTAAQSRVLGAASPTCGDGSGRKCFCDTCNNGANQSCASNADCPDPPGPIGPICGGRRCLGGSNVGAACTANSECPGGGLCVRSGEPSKPNGCVDDTVTAGPDCVDTVPVDGEGECAAGPVTKHCSVASGHPQRSCSVDADCGGSGTCLGANRSCFLDEGVVGGAVSVSGTATPPVGNASDPTDLGALTCLSPTGASAVNVAGGFPGLARGFYPGRAIFAEEVVVEVAPPGGTVTTAGSGPASVVETTVTTPTGGEVEIVGTFNAGAPPSGYEFLGRLVQITAQPATAGNPLRIGFDIAASEVPIGQNENTIAIFRDGVGPIPNCPGSSQAIPDDPCVTERAALGGGAIRITVLSSHASEWTMAAPDFTFCPPAVDPGCRGPLVSRKSSLLLSDRTPDTKDQLQWKWLTGAATTVGEFGNPTATDDYGLCIYNDVGLAAALFAPAGGTCAGKSCWSAKPTGFTYKDKDLSPTGIAQIVLKAGADGKAQIQVKGKGDALVMPAIGSSMVVQLRNVATSQCWTATYSAPFDKYDGITLKDKAD